MLLDFVPTLSQGSQGKLGLPLPEATAQTALPIGLPI